LTTLNGVGNIDPKPKRRLLKLHDNQKTSRLHNPTTMEMKWKIVMFKRLTAIRKMESLGFPISPTILVSSSLFLNNIEEENI